MMTRASMACADQKEIEIRALLLLYDDRWDGLHSFCIFTCSGTA